MIERAEQCTALSDYTIVSGGQGERLPFPLDNTYVSFECSRQNSGFLLGDAQGFCLEETLRLSVLSPQAEGAAYCRQAAESICQAVLTLDEEKRIISVSAGKCVPDERVGGRRIEIEFGLRGIRLSGG